MLLSAAVGVIARERLASRAVRTVRLADSAAVLGRERAERTRERLRRGRVGGGDARWEGRARASDGEHATRLVRGDKPSRAAA